MFRNEPIAPVRSSTSEFTWDGYRIPLTPESPRPSAAPVICVHTAPLASRASRLTAALLDAVLNLLVSAPGLYVRNSFEGIAELRSRGNMLLLGGLALLAAVQWTLLTRCGQTVGKKLMGIRIVRATDESNPGFFRVVVLRSFLPLLLGVGCGLFGLIDMLWILNEDQRCIHDHFAGTKVVDV
jgi:uncharacterized RDD family membrane protein YckC